MKSIGGGYAEATCMTCGEIFIFSEEDNVVIKVDEAGDVWPLCSRCCDKPCIDLCQGEEPDLDANTTQ
ncbi:MAG: hypothetical protein WCJ35_16200 [Planctomycetota bacterium]